MNDLWQLWALRPRWQQHLGQLLLALALLAVMAAALWRPLWQAHTQAQAEHPKLAEAYQALLALSQQQPQWQAQRPLAEAALAQLQQRLPTQDKPDLASPIHQLLAAQGLNLNHAQPLADVDDEGLTTHAYAFGASGEAEAVGTLLYQLATHPDVLIISQFTLNALPDAAQPYLHLEARLHTLRLTPPQTEQEAHDETP